MQERHICDRAIQVAVLLLPLLVYWPVVAFPYLLVDDNWLMRGWAEPDYPSSSFISSLQGRPGLAYLAWITGGLIRTYGETGIQIMRLGGIAGLGAASVFLFAYTRYLPLTMPFRILAATIWVTLPASQVVAANGSWLAVGIASAIGAVLILLRPMSWINSIAVMVLLWVSLSVYQATFFIAPALYLLTRYDVSRSRWHPPTAARLALMAGALVIYYAAWKFAYAYNFPGSQEARYSPGSTIRLNHWLGRIIFYIPERIRMALLFWDIPRETGRTAIYANIVLALFALAAAYAWFTQQSLRASARAWRLILIPIAIFTAEIASMFTLSPVLSYTTFIGTTVLSAIFAAWLLSYVFSSFQLRGAFSAVLVIVTLAMVTASISVSRHFAVPTFLDMRDVSAYAQRRDAEREPDGTIVMCLLWHSRKPALGIDEFSWSNMPLEFYAHWHNRAVLDLMHKDSTKLITVVRDTLGERPDAIMPAGASTQGRCGPNEFLDTSQRTKHDLFGDKPAK